jgi:hypothetical protein
MSDEKIKIYCVRCKGFTNHEILSRISKTFTPENTPHMGIDFAEGSWEILECRGCEEVTFRETWINSEDVNDRTGMPEPSIKLYPQRSEKMLPIKPHYSLSPTLHQIYRETIDSHNQGFQILCAVGIRTLIEGICSDKGIKDGPVQDENGVIKRAHNLQGKIEGMVEAGFLTKEHATTLHELRFLGNEAVHEFRAPSLDEFQIVIEILEHTLDNLYELTEKTDILRLKKRTRSK